MQVALKGEWRLDVTGDELTLISKALTGNLKPGERKVAFELAKNMAAQRHVQSSTALEVSAGALKHFETTPEFPKE